MLVRPQAQALIELLRCTAVAALAVALVGCPGSFPLASDSGVIDSAAPDETPDGALADVAAPPCTDEDGDLILAASCGGNDCDDHDPTVRPGSARCASATVSASCEDGGRLAITSCAAPTPYCDARTGRCTTDACGDGVVHPDEDCEPDVPGPWSHCQPDCHVECLRTSDCAALVPDHSCFPMRSGGLMSGVCVDDVSGGAPLGASCSVDSDCESAYCDVGQARCSQACWSLDDCPAADGSWCPATSWPRDELPLACDFPCATTAECPTGSVCDVMNVADDAAGMHGGATCQRPQYAGAIGAPCSDGCATGACDADDRCTVTCVVDGDCPAEVPVCTVLEPITYYGGISVCVAP